MDEKLTELLRSMSRYEDAEVTPDASFGADLGMNSFDFLQLLYAVEMTFEQFPEDESSKKKKKKRSMQPWSARFSSCMKPARRITLSIGKHPLRWLRMPNQTMPDQGLAVLLLSGTDLSTRPLTAGLQTVSIRSSSGLDRR